MALATGWAVATFAAATMHGFWWPGRHVVVVVPLAVLAILMWVSRSGLVVRTAALALGVGGVASYVALLVDGYTGGFTWVSAVSAGGAEVNGPSRALLPDYRGELWALHLTWCAVFTVLALVAARTAHGRMRHVTESTRS